MYVAGRIGENSAWDSGLPNVEGKGSGSEVRSSFRRHGRYLKKMSMTLRTKMNVPLKEIRESLPGQRERSDATPCQALRIVNRLAAAGVARSQGVHHL